MASAKKATEGFDVMSAMNPAAFKEGFERVSDGVRATADFHKGSFEAVVSSASTLAKGVETAAGDHAAFIKEAFEDGAAATKATTTASSIQEAIEIQSNFARTAFEKNIGFVSKIAEHWTGVAKESADPLTKRYGEFVELVQSYRP